MEDYDIIYNSYEFNYIAASMRCIGGLLAAYAYYLLIEDAIVSKKKDKLLILKLLLGLFICYVLLVKNKKNIYKKGSSYQKLLNHVK